MFSLNTTTHCFQSDLVNYPHGFGTVKTGNALNKEDLQSFFSKKSTYIAFCEQIHSTHVFEVSTHNLIPGMNNRGKGDGLFTKDYDITLFVKTADCVPIIFASHNEVAISHQGWKGTSEKMIENIVSFFPQNDKASLKLLIGPSIGKCCYNITRTQAEIYESKFPLYTEEILEYKEDEVFVDLQKLNYLQALAVGIKKEHIDICNYCTKCRSDLFFSYRGNNKKVNGGHMISYITHI
jgi:YfiH family protein